MLIMFYNFVNREFSRFTANPRSRQLTKPRDLVLRVYTGEEESGVADLGTWLSVEEGGVYGKGARE